MGGGSYSSSGSVRYRAISTRSENGANKYDHSALFDKPKTKHSLDEIIRLEDKRKWKKS